MHGTVVGPRARVAAPDSTAHALWRGAGAGGAVDSPGPAPAAAAGQPGLQELRPGLGAPQQAAELAPFRRVAVTAR